MARKCSTNPALTRYSRRGKPPARYAALVQRKVALVRLQRTGTSHPLTVAGLKPKDLAPAADFLASDVAVMVTCASYDVTAGDAETMV
jgi:hypothetical protein